VLLGVFEDRTQRGGEGVGKSMLCLGSYRLVTQHAGYEMRRERRGWRLA
jgi:hypothetical protein